MGTLSLSKMGRLFWLGRYTERVYTSLKLTRDILDADVDGTEADYAGYCRKTGIPNIYADTADFCRRYYFDQADPCSILSSLGCSYDNAVVLRETLSTETLAYIQMAMNAMSIAAGSSAPGVALQWVLDDIMAFRGSAEERIGEEGSRAVLKAGASLERVDLYLRLDQPLAQVRGEFERLFDRLYKTQLHPDKARLDFLTDALLDSAAALPPRAELIAAVEGLFPEV